MSRSSSLNYSFLPFISGIFRENPRSWFVQRIPVWDESLQPHGIIKSSLITHGLRHSVSGFTQVPFCPKAANIRYPLWSHPLSPCGWIINSIVCFLVAVKKTRQKQTAVSSTWQVCTTCLNIVNAEYWLQIITILSAWDSIKQSIDVYSYPILSTNACVPLRGTLILLYSNPTDFISFFSSSIQAKKLQRLLPPLRRFAAQNLKICGKRIIRMCFCLFLLVVKYILEF